MHVAVVANTAWYLVNFRLNLMRALQLAGHQVLAVAPDDASQVALLRSAGIRFVPVQITGAGINPIRELQSVWALSRIFKREGVQVVFSYTPKGNLYSSLAALATDLPFVPNVSGLGRSFIRKSWVTLVVKLLYRLTFGRAYRVFFQNLDDMGFFVQAGLAPAARCERLPGSGVDLSSFKLQPMPLRELDAPVFLLVARLMWDKGVGEFAQAARRVLQRYPKARFQLLGYLDVANPSAIDRAQVQTWEAERLLTYLGPTDDVRPYLMDADAVVLPSYREGVPRTLLEAAAMGRPVITTDAPGCRDTVEAGVSGLLCRVADANDLAKKLLAYIALSGDERAKMGRMGRERMELHFDEQFVIQKYLDLVRDLDEAKFQ